MEYQFTHTMHGVVAKCSMDHEAFAHWLNTEISEDSSKLNEVFKQLEQCKREPNHECMIYGREYCLYLSQDEVVAQANSLSVELDDLTALEELGEGFGYYDDESASSCGLEDFEHFLNAYVKFLNVYH